MAVDARTGIRTGSPENDAAPAGQRGASLGLMQPDRELVLGMAPLRRAHPRAGAGASA